MSLEYGAIKSQLEIENITNPTIKDVSNAVIAIRQSKLPDPAELGNSGSFFKNPIISTDLFNEIKKSNPSINCYPVNETHVKIAAGVVDRTMWLERETHWQYR